jgi:hypothetical protein
MFRYCLEFPDGFFKNYTYGRKALTPYFIALDISIRKSAGDGVILR